MANFKLDYTAEEVNHRLGMIQVDSVVETVVSNAGFRLGNITTTGGIDYSSTIYVISDQITIDGYDYLDVELVDENYKIGMYAIHKDSGKIIQFNSKDYIYHGTVRCDDSAYAYVVRLALVSGSNITVEGAKNALRLTLGKHGDPQFKLDEIKDFCKGEKLYFPHKEPFFEHSCGNSGYVQNRSNAVTRPIPIGDYDGIRFTFKDTGFYYKLYSVSEDGAYTTLYSSLTAPYEIEFTDKSVKYVLVVDKANHSANYTKEEMDSIPDALTIEYFYSPTVYGYTRQYADISHTLKWERKKVTDGAMVDSTTAIMAELPRWGCFEVRLNDPNTNWYFRVFKCDKSGVWTELTDGACYYTYRTHANIEANSDNRYYVQVEMANGSTIDEYSAHAIRAFTYEDVGVTQSKSNPSLYGKKIAVIGDSIVHGRMCKHGTKVNMVMVKPWSHLIAEACNVEPANFGIGGARVQNNDWRSLYAKCVNVSGHDVVFVCAGTNDYSANVADATFREAYSHVIATLVEANTKVVVCTPVYRTNKTGANSAGLTLSDYANIEKEIAEANGCRVVDVLARTSSSEFAATMSDGLHPNEVGHRMIADIILDEY